MFDPTSPLLKGGDLDSSFYTADNGDNGALPNPPSSASSIGSAPVDPSSFRRGLYSEVSTATDATEDTGLTYLMNKMGIQQQHNPPTSRVSFVTNDDIYRMPDVEEVDQARVRWQQKTSSELAEVRSTAKSTKKDTTQLLAKADEQKEDAATYHEDAMHGQEETKDLIEEGHEEILDTMSLQHEVSFQNQSDMLENQKAMMTMVQEALEAARADGNVSLVKKLQKQLEEQQEAYDKLHSKCNTLHSKWIKKRNEKHELQHKLNAAHSTIAKMTPQKPRRGLAPLPSNRPPIPATKRMVAAEMKHVGLKTDDALVEAEGVKRGNSSTLLP